jgi:hypothetical protein
MNKAGKAGLVNRGDRIRTCDFLLPKQALYQAELRPVVRGGGLYASSLPLPRG